MVRLAIRVPLWGTLVLTVGKEPGVTKSAARRRPRENNEIAGRMALLALSTELKKAGRSTLGQFSRSGASHNHWKPFAGEGVQIG